jgi:hypothetical protein
MFPVGSPGSQLIKGQVLNRAGVAVSVWETYWGFGGYECRRRRSSIGALFIAQFFIDGADQLVVVIDELLRKRGPTP